MANYFVDGGTGNDGDAGTTMDAAWDTIEKALETGGLAAGAYVWVRQGHSEIPASDIACAYDGTVVSPLVIAAWPRPAKAINCDWVNGSTTVDNVDGNDITNDNALGRYITGPDGKQYTITKITDTNTFIIDREYAGSTAANQNVSILADELWAADMGATYGFDDDAWTIKEAAWDADALAMPFIDFNDGSYQVLLENDTFHCFHNIKFMDSGDGAGIVRATSTSFTNFVGCYFLQSASNTIGMGCAARTVLYLDRCIFVGSGDVADTSQNCIQNSGGFMCLKDCAICSWGNSGIDTNAGVTYLDNVNIGVEGANQNDDMTMSGGVCIGKDVKFGGTNGYVDRIALYSTHYGKVSPAIAIENFGKVLGVHKSYYSGGSYETATLTGVTTPNKTVSDVAILVTPSVNNVKLNIHSMYRQKFEAIFTHEFEATTDSKTYKYWVYNGMSATLNDTTAFDDIWLEAEYVSGYDDTTEYVMSYAYSSEIDILAAANAADWDYLQVTVQPAVASKVRIRLMTRAYSAAGTYYVDPAVVIS